MSKYVAQGTGTFEITRIEIEALRYLNDPAKAATYLGIPQVQVEDVWAEMVEPRQRSDTDGPADPRDHAHTIRADNEASCERLKCALLNAMSRWADSNGTTPEETVGFLLYGVKDFTRVKESTLSTPPSNGQRMADAA